MTIIMLNECEGGIYEREFKSQNHFIRRHRFTKC